jgi:hypothetical protein
MKRLKVVASDPEFTKHWQRKNAEEKRPAFKKLIAKLLALEPKSIVIALDDPDIDKVVTQGREWSTVGMKILRGQRNECHKNCDLFFKAGGINQVVTGYYLSEYDLAWRQHSWGLINGAIVETTPNKARRYFGVIIRSQR